MKDVIRSSAAEYLTFISATGQSCVEVIYADENTWLSQKMMATLYEIESNTINYHLKKFFSNTELDKNSVIDYSEKRCNRKRQSDACVQHS